VALGVFASSFLRTAFLGDREGSSLGDFNAAKIVEFKTKLLKYGG
jgi:hypothetical protein